MHTARFVWPSHAPRRPRSVWQVWVCFTRQKGSITQDATVLMFFICGPDPTQSKRRAARHASANPLRGPHSSAHTFLRGSRLCCSFFRGIRFTVATVQCASHTSEHCSSILYSVPWYTEDHTVFEYSVFGIQIGLITVQYSFARQTELRLARL